MWKKELLIDLLRQLYKKYNVPITQKIYLENYKSPTIKVFIRVFGSFKDACNVANVPHGYEQYDYVGKYKTKRLGEEKYDTTGTLMKIIEYNNAHDITVEYQDKYRYKFHTSYQSWTNNKFINPYAVTVCGKGYIGNTTTSINGEEKIAYAKWVSMLKRCYINYYEHHTYIDCFVCDEWLCFENFEKWFDKNYYEIEDSIMCLDKDILVKNNKVYSPETCCIVPHEINVIFVKNHATRGEYPIGVQQGNDGAIVSCLSEYGKHVYLGRFNSVLDAFNAYKNEKERYIKEVADLYKNKIPEKIYNAMYKYEVEEDD